MMQDDERPQVRVDVQVNVSIAGRYVAAERQQRRLPLTAGQIFITKPDPNLGWAYVQQGSTPGTGSICACGWLSTSATTVWAKVYPMAGYVPPPSPPVGCP